MASEPPGAPRRAAALTARDARALRDCVADGGVAVLPTDTVYGLCCDPDDGAAVARLYALKGRPASRPAAVMFFALEPALAALGELLAAERRALEALLPGALTLLLANRGGRFAPACGPEPGTLGLRVPRLPERLAALGSLEIAVMQSSANISGERDPRSLEEVPARLRRGAELTLDGGELPGTPSTVLDLRDYARSGRWSIVRAGALSEQAVRAALSDAIVRS